MHLFRLPSLMVLSCAVLAGMAPGGILSPSVAMAQESPSSLEGLFLSAEKETDKEKSIGMWAALLARDDLAGKAKDNPAFSPARIRATIVEDYLSLYREEKDIDHLEKAKDFIRSSYKDAKDRAWAYAYLFARMAAGKEFSEITGARKLAADFEDQAKLAIAEVGDAEAKEKLFYTLCFALTGAMEGKPVFDAGAMAQVHDLAMQMNNPAHRLQVMRRLAVAGRDVSGAYPEIYAPLYDLLGKEEKKVPVKELVGLYEQAMADDRFDLALASLLAIQDKDDRKKHLFSFFEKTFSEKKDTSRARRIAERIDNPAKAVDAWSALGGYYLIAGYPQESESAYKNAEIFANKISKESSRAKAHKLIADRKERDQKKAEKKSEKIDGADRKLADQALKLFAQDGIAAAVGVARQIKDPIFRAKTFRRLAEDQTKLNDKYNILDAQSGWAVVSGAKSLPEPLPIEKIQAFENAVAEKNNADPMGKVVQDALPSPIGERIEVDPLVARLKADGDTVRAAVPLPGPGRIARAYYENNLYNSKFYEVAGNAGFADWQKSGAPEAIVIENGIVDLPAIYDAMRNDGLDDYIVRDGKTYYLRRPLVVGPKAALVVTGDDVEAVKMSTQSGAYIVVVGKLYFSDSKLIGWNDEKSEPMWAEYKDKRQFRPYLTSWSQSEMHIGNSEIVAIGYGNGKSYGISLSAGPNIWFKFGNDPHFQRPKATIVDNSIRNTLYGFYSYEADDVVLSGNEYIDNIVYGVDPHDRSHRLAIGYNTAYDTHKKHGIIISREVADSIIFGNLTFDNKGTGIMLDRDSNGTFVYGNTSFHNKQDGLTLFESDCEIVAANNIFENHGSGFRIRNSYNIGLFYNDLSRNGAAGVSAYDATLKGNPAHKTRDFDLDPYDEFTAIAAIGNKMEANNIGLGVEAIDGIFLKKNTFIDQSPKVLRGAMFRENPELLFRYDQKGNGVSVNATCPALAAPLYVQECKYRKDGTLAGDGLDYLIGRVKASACAKSTTTVKHVPHSEEDDAEE